jgi:transketolase
VKKTRCCVSCEEHNILGGLGSAVAEVLGENFPCPLERVGVEDVFGKSGSPDELLNAFGLTSENIAEKVRKVLQRK